MASELVVPWVSRVKAKNGLSFVKCGSLGVSLLRWKKVAVGATEIGVTCCRTDTVIEPTLNICFKSQQLREKVIYCHQANHRIPSKHLSSTSLNGEYGTSVNTNDPSSCLTGCSLRHVLSRQNSSAQCQLGT